MIVILAPTAQLAADTLTLDNPPALTVEAEYGAWVAQGSRYTAAHHQPIGSEYAGRHIGGDRPAPCNDPNIPLLDENEVALISHIDVDTLGGLMRAQPDFQPYFSEEFQPFWDFVEFVDTMGWHKADPAHPEYARLSAFAAWSQKNRINTPRDQNTDVTDFVTSALGFLTCVLKYDPEAIALGASYLADQDSLNEKSWIRTTPFGLVVRRSTAFVNHLYRDPTGEVGSAVISLNDKTGAITISLADPIPNLSCRAVVQELWGSEAGGHDGIAGSPRGTLMSEDDLLNAVNHFSKAIVSAIYKQD